MCSRAVRFQGLVHAEIVHGHETTLQLVFPRNLLIFPRNSPVEGGGSVLRSAVEGAEEPVAVIRPGTSADGHLLDEV